MLLFRSLVALALACLLVASTASGDATPALLLPGETLERELAAGEEHAYRVATGVDRPLRVVVEQHGVDVEIVDVEIEAGGKVADGPFDRRFAESILLERDEFVLRGRELGAPAGRYVLRLETVGSDVHLEAARAETAAAKLYPDGTADAWRRAIEHHRRAESAWREAGDDEDAARHLYARAVLHRLADEPQAALEAAEEARAAFRHHADPASEAYAHNELGLGHWRLGDLREARAAFHRTASLAEVYDDRYLLAAASANLCLMHLARGQILQGRICYEDALPVIEAARAPETESAARTNLGRIAEHLGEPDEALLHHRRALEIYTETDNRRGQAQALNNLGVLLRGRGDYDLAMDRYGQALEIFRELGRQHWQGLTLTNIGYLYLAVKNPQRSLISFTAALTLFRASGDERGEANAIDNLGLARRELGQPEEALLLHREALELRRRESDRRGEAVTLRRIGTLLSELGRDELAHARLREAVEIAAAVGDVQNEAEARRALGELFLEKGELEPSRRELQRSLELATGLGAEEGEGRARLALARWSRARGDRRTAREQIDAAIGHFEHTRARIASPSLRTTYSELLRQSYELKLGLLMAAHREKPAAGYDLVALEVAERSRARALLDLLQEAEIELAPGEVEELRQEREALVRRLDAKTQRLVSVDRDSPLRAALEAEQLEILQQIETLEAAIRRDSPSYSEIAGPVTPSAAEIRGLVTGDTTLAVYFLGETESYLWHVTSRGVETHVLPARQVIAETIRRAHGRWSGTAEAETEGELADLSRLASLLRISDLAPGRRLAVIADGPLHLLPFAALPVSEPGAHEAPGRLGDEREIVFVPSTSFLALDRGRRATPGSRSVAILADPAFGPDSPPLPGSRREAERILEVIGNGGHLLALGPDADRELASSSRLATFDIVHFATHGVIDDENPALSGLLLSRSDAPGREGGFLHLQEIFDLRLDAELVVLSGCRTALGPEVRGEGLQGLVRAFLYAGAQRVMASLWPVDDRATAVFMERFYRHLWDGRTASESLSLAQRDLRSLRRYRDPRYWASFVLVGDWR